MMTHIWYPYDPLIYRSMRDPDGWVWAIIQIEEQKQYASVRYLGVLEKWVIATIKGEHIFCDQPIKIARIISPEEENECME